MKHTNFKIAGILLLAFLFVNTNTNAQVGIGTVTPDASSMLDISTTTKGLLAPRMTTAQKNAIVTPVNGLLVYDIDLGKFNYYNGTGWITIDSNIGRNNYVLVKTASDFPAPVTGVITLVAGTMYEINGTINLTDNIELNGCEIAGRDSNNDKLVFTGTGALFTGTKGGIIKNVTLAGNTTNNLFSVNDSSQLLNLFLRDAVVASFASVGTITGYNLVLLDLVSLASNTTGLTYTDVKHLFLLNSAWFSSNLGTYCTLVGTFYIVGIIGGTYDNESGTAGIDVSGITSIVDDAILQGASFGGAATRVVGSFTKEWEVDSSGLPTEKDDVASGTISISSPALTSIPSTNTPVKASGSTTSENLFRFDTDGGTNNRLKYTGTKTRIFSVVISASITAPNSGQILSLYVAKNGAVINSTRIQRKIINGSDIGAVSVSGTVELATGDYVELWLANNNTNKDATIESMNFKIN